MLYQLLQIACHILFELADTLGAEGVGDGLSFAGVFGSVTGVEDASLNGDEGVIVVAVKMCLCQQLVVRVQEGMQSVRVK